MTKKRNETTVPQKSSSKKSSTKHKCTNKSRKKISLKIKKNVNFQSCFQVKPIKPEKIHCDRDVSKAGFFRKREVIQARRSLEQNADCYTEGKI